MEACQAKHAISTTSRRELPSSIFFLAKQSAEGNSRKFHRTLGQHVPLYVTVKNWVAV
jgi:hypothetical protein